jgi:sulfur-oxidizing protein SoxY
MDAERRTLLKGTGAAGSLGLALAAGILRPSELLAADWNKAAFSASSVVDTLKTLGASSPTESKDIAIKAPEIAENGAVVPVEVTTNLPNTQSIAIIVEKNPVPLAAEFDLASDTEPFVATRIKMAETSRVIALVKAGDKHYTAVREVKVTIGGCGG